MDYRIYFSLRREVLKNINIHEEMTTWGNITVSYTPKRFWFDKKVRLVEIQTKDMKSDFIMLMIVDGLRELEWQANKQVELIEANHIIKLLEEICLMDYFSIYIEEDDAKIEKEIEYDNRKNSNIAKIITKTLNWDNFTSIKIVRY